MREGWVLKKLGDVCTLQRGFDLPKRLREPGVFPLISSSGEIDSHTEAKVKGPGVATGRSGSIGNVFYIEKDFWPLNTVLYVKDFHGNYERFVYHLLKQFDLGKYASGAGVPTLNRNHVHDIEIYIPEAIEEQKRIVAMLDEAFAGIDAAIANTEKNLANARELFESYLNNIFSMKGEGWITKTLGEVGKVSMCKRILKKQTTASGDIPFYKIGTFGKEPNAFISNDIYQDFKEKYSFPKKGDVLISASGTIGRRVIYDGMPAYFQDSNIVWIDNDEKLVLNDYLYQFYGVCDWNPSKGATISRLYNDDLRKIKISFPSITEQKKLIETMVGLNSQTQNLETIYQSKLSALVGLKQSLLQKAFSGELMAEGDKLMDEAVA